MEQINKNILTAEAGKAAVYFGLISGGFIIINFLCTGWGAFGSILTSLLSIGKIVGCIWLMVYMMKRLKANYEGVHKRELVSYGTLIALFSAIITAVVTYISYKYLFADSITAIMDELYVQLRSMMSADMVSRMVEMESSMAVYSMMGNLIWCFLYGWILSLIAAPRIAPENIFED